MPKSSLLNTQINSSIETVEEIGGLVNKYGFLIVFAVVILVLIIAFFFNYNKRINKKQESELEILNKERNASIEQNKQMFDLVTQVQTQQVVQLQQMTESLKEMNNSIKENEQKFEQANQKFEGLKSSITTCDENYRTIIDTLSEILEYVKNSEVCNKEILEKIDLLEHNLIQLSNSRVS